jgi:hypothetical protein
MRTKIGIEIVARQFIAPEFSAPEFDAFEFGMSDFGSLELPIPELPELMDLQDPPYELDQWMPEPSEEIDLYCYETLDDEIFEPVNESSKIFKTPIAAMKVSGPMFDSVYALHPIPCQR